MNTPAEKIAKRRADIPQIYQNFYYKAMSGKNRAAGVKSFCLECTGWVKEEVRLCTAPQCPLYPYRPYRNSTDANGRHLAQLQSTNGREGA